MLLLVSESQTLDAVLDRAIPWRDDVYDYLASLAADDEVQEHEGRHYCMLWRESPSGLSTGSSVSRPLAICRAALDLAVRSRRLPLANPGQRGPAETRA